MPTEKVRAHPGGRRAQSDAGRDEPYESFIHWLQ